MTAERVRDPERLAVTRRFGRGEYQIAAVLSLIAAVQAVVLAAAADGPRWLWPAAAVLAAGGLTAAAKSIPYDHVTFPPR